MFSKLLMKHFLLLTEEHYLVNGLSQKRLIKTTMDVFGVSFIKDLNQLSLL
jgi:hypothetical protein